MNGTLILFLILWKMSLNGPLLGTRDLEIIYLVILSRWLAVTSNHIRIIHVETVQLQMLVCLDGIKDFNDVICMQPKVKL